MREFEVQFTTKANGPSGHPEKAVVEIGSAQWKMKREAAIEWLKSDPQTFFVRVGDQKVRLAVAVRDGQSWLRTSADWAEQNRLLDLPNFPADFGK